MRNQIQTRERGFSLMEVMIGMAMGMIVVVVIMQAFAVAEGYKRTTTTGQDAQTNGLLALRALESEIRMAGYGLANAGNLCPSINSINPSTGNIASPPLTNAPITIVDGGTGSDTIEVLYSSTFAGAAPSRITTAMPTPSNVLWVNTTTGFSVCDFFLLASKDGTKACTLQQATDVQDAQDKILTSSGQSNYNPPGGFAGALYPPGGYSTSDIVINMGKYIDRKFLIYRDVVSGVNTDDYVLRRSKVITAADGCQPVDPNPNVDLVGNIVYMKAQYGIAETAGSQQVTCWTSAAATNTGCSISSGNWSAPTITDVKKIKAIRVAVVARSALKEKPSSGTTCDTTTTAPTLSWTTLGSNSSAVPALTLSTLPNWQCYRYKTYQTVIPLINVIWANS